MIDWDAETVADAAGAELVLSSRAGGGPRAAGVDSRAIAPGELFVGLRGEREDGGRYAARALAAGAWGVLVAPEHAAALGGAAGGVVLAHPDPLAGLQALARSWRRELGAHGARVVAITGSTGKTSTKDILAALLAAHMPTTASPQNLNTEIGLPLAILAAGREDRALVLEMAMRGAGQIAALTAIAEPDVGAIVNVGPAHLEQLGSLEAIAAAKAELIAGLQPGAVAVLPAGEPLLERHRRAQLRTLTFGEGGDVRPIAHRADGSVVIRHGTLEMELTPSFRQAHQLRNLLAAVAAARALGIAPAGPLQVTFSAMRGQRRALPGGIVLIDDCYNANPMSMRAAIDDLAASAAGRRVAVLGDMLELGEQAPALHRELAGHAGARGIELLVAVGPLAREMCGSFAGCARSAADAEEAARLLPGLLREGDTVLVKGSRGVGLEHVVQALEAAGKRPAASAQAARGDAPSAGPGRR